MAITRKPGSRGGSSPLALALGAGVAAGLLFALVQHSRGQLGGGGARRTALEGGGSDSELAELKVGGWVGG